ncbi:uncharacterized protein AMSG_02069 [Thecamonas trahens ATCC 50062]|uniref:G-protein coupled receptors family 2 profile 2 domain-containing protein n=1 Tax=Thecamonas trahens ATCC 50062 TaxID=461836 RepID=A0A0L0DV35_THETB|nr:hypothetical protein AMSG_02069 [Thecamonas trahens ATCC 50062]KNC56057.1 hypothetical protein AMSG_02069 [Thecamonas trahens ATCC 50062]|eukprot:XP_013761101.1 hypothetical protein AMSG_02069 [Thecamonas trahens ATCC 50062]
MLTVDEGQRLLRLLRVMSYASLVSSFLVVLTFAVFPTKRSSLGQVLTLCFCLSALGLTVGLLISTSWVSLEQVFASRSLCHLQAVFIQFFGSSCIIFFLLIAVNLYRMVVRKGLHVLSLTRRAAALEQRRADALSVVFTWPVQVSIGFMYAVVMTLIPLVANGFGPHHMYCWISGDDWGFIFGTLYAEMLGCLLVGGFLWLRIVYLAQRIHALAAKRSAAQRERAKLLDRNSRSGMASSHASAPLLGSPAGGNASLPGVTSGSMRSEASPPMALLGSPHPPTATISTAGSSGNSSGLMVARHLAFVAWFAIVFSIMASNELYMYSGHISYTFWVFHVLALGGIGVSTLITCGCSKLNYRLWRNLIVSCWSSPTAVSAVNSPGLPYAQTSPYGSTRRS